MADSGQESSERRKWRWTEAVIGSIVAAAIIALAGAFIGLRDGFREHQIYIQDYLDFRDAGDRCTASDCAILTREQEELEARQERIWAEIRGHIKQGEHSVAGYRLNAQNRRIEEILRRIEALERND